MRNYNYEALKLLKEVFLMRNYNYKDYLVVLKDSYIESPEEIRRQFWIDSNNVLDFDWMDEAVFNNNDTRVLNTFSKKIYYLYATLHDDKLIESIIKEILPEITQIKVPWDREGHGNNLIRWIEDENIGMNLKSFLTDRKYILICDSGEVRTLKELGLLNLDNVEMFTTLGDDDDEYSW